MDEFLPLSEAPEQIGQVAVKEDIFCEDDLSFLCWHQPLRFYALTI
ncbi:hypothetical protein DSUL_140032 [Desulfovibrionales bacterium]